MSSRRTAVVITAIGAGGLVWMALIDFVGSFLPWGPFGVVYLVAGGWLTWKAPKNLIGWLLLTTASLGGLGGSLITLARQSGDMTVAGWLDAVGSAATTIAVLAIPLVLLRFPNGRLLSRRWRLIEMLTIVAAGVGASAALLNGGWGGDQSQAVVPSPLYEATTPLGDILSTVFFPLMGLAMLSSGASLIFRYRRAFGEEPAQLKWLAYSGAIFLVTSLIMIFTEQTVAVDEAWQQALLVVTFSTVPVAVVISVLKYRLYDIDVVINRTVVLAVLAVFITATYAVVVVGVGQLIGGDSDDLLLPIVATAVVAVAFEPVRHRAQRWANRLVYGKRATPYEVLSDLTERLAGAEEGEGLLARMADLLRDGTGAERATIWLGVSGEMTEAVSSPSDVVVQSEPTLDDERSFPVIHDGEVIGALEVVKPKGSALSTAERSLITDLAGSAGAVLGYQRLNESLAQRARELEESRARLVGAQDQERRKLERELHEGAEQFIVALKVKIGVAARLAEQHQADQLEELLEGLTAEAQAALDDVQSLAKGIYPPILESDGLEAAIAALASSAPIEIQFERDGVGRYPAEVEAAVYFDISEAVTNAVKHADPPIHIELFDAEGVLRFSVTDSGPGFDLDESDPGSGMENMADRLLAVGGDLTVKSSAGDVTRVSGEIPLVTASI